VPPAGIAALDGVLNGVRQRRAIDLFLVQKILRAFANQVGRQIALLRAGEQDHGKMRRQCLHAPEGGRAQAVAEIRISKMTFHRFTGMIAAASIQVEAARFLYGPSMPLALLLDFNQNLFEEQKIFGIGLDQQDSQVHHHLVWDGGGLSQGFGPQLGVRQNLLAISYQFGKCSAANSRWIAIHCSQTMLFQGS